MSAIVARAVRVPRRTKRSCLAWPQAAAFRMLKNNLDPETPSVRTSSTRCRRTVFNSASHAVIPHVVTSSAVDLL